MSRQEFLDRVSQAVRTGNRYRPHVAPFDETCGYVGAGVDAVERLLQEVAAVGGQALAAASWAEARERLDEILQRHRPRTALCWQHPVLDQLELPAWLAGHGVRHVSYDELARLPPAAQRDSALAADLGITSVDWAIAETGSLVLQSRPGHERMASLLPPVHVAVVTTKQILPDLFDLFDQLASQGIDQLPSNLVLITGPSKTGDIELTLTTGVHGPGTWYVLVVRTA